MLARGRIGQSSKCPRVHKALVFMLARGRRGQKWPEGCIQGAFFNLWPLRPLATSSSGTYECTLYAAFWPLLATSTSGQHEHKGLMNSGTLRALSNATSGQHESLGRMNVPRYITNLRYSSGTSAPCRGRGGLHPRGISPGTSSSLGCPRPAPSSDGSAPPEGDREHRLMLDIGGSSTAQSVSVF